MDTQFPPRSGQWKAWFARPLKFAACVSALLGFFTWSAAAQPNPLVVSTVAGLGNFGDADGVGSAARFLQSTGVAVDGFGNVYVADPENSTIRKVTPLGIVTTLAGTPQVTGTNDGPGSSALFNQPYGVAVDTSGNVYVADTYNGTIRKITTNGVVTTFAGVAGVTNQYRDGYLDGYLINPAANLAEFGLPFGIAVDVSNNIYVADTYTHLIRKISSGFVSTLAGDNNISDIDNHINSGHNDGTGSGARFYYPYALATDGAGNVYVADTDNNLIRQITPAGVVTTIAGTNINGASTNNGTFSLPFGIAVDSATNIYVSDTYDQVIQLLVPSGTNWVVSPSSPLAGQMNRYGDGDGTLFPDDESFKYPWGVAVDGATNVFVGDSDNANIREISFDETTSGWVLTTLGGPDGSYGFVDGPGVQARFNQPYAVAVDGASNLYVADSLNNCIREITPDGTVSTLAGSISGESGSSDGTNANALFNNPTGLCLDAATNIYVADYDNSTVRMITPDAIHSNWVTTTIAGQVTNFSFTNGMGTNATFNGPRSVAVDSSTNLYVTDNGNGVVRIIAPGGGVANYTATNSLLYSPTGIAVDSSTNVYVTDDVNSAVYIIAPGSPVAQFDSGDASLLNSPEGIALDTSTNVYVANSGSNTILGFNFAGKFKGTLAGTAGFVGSADGLGAAAQFDFPAGLAVDASGNVYVADVLNNTIREGMPFDAGQTAVLTLTTSPSGLELEVNGTNDSSTPEVLSFATGSMLSVTTTTTNIGYEFGFDGTTIIATNYYLFDDWTSNGVVINATTNYTFALDTNVTLVANYTPLYTYTANTSSANEGTVAGGGTNVPGATLVTVTATPINNFRFGSWTFDNFSVSTNASYTFALEGNEALVANFLPPLYSLTLDNSPTNGGLALGAGLYESNTTVTVTALTNNAFVFIDWTTNGGGSNLSSSFSFTLDTNETLVANYLALCTLTTTNSPAEGGTSFASFEGTNSSLLEVLSGSVVTVTAMTNPGYAFIDWSTNDGGTNSSGSFSFPLEASETLVANFAPYYTLTVSNSPAAGGMAYLGAGGSNLYVVSNTPVAATAATNPGYAFIDWSTNGIPASAANPYDFPLDTNLTLVANFAPYYTVSVASSPDGEGTAIAWSGGASGTDLYVLSNSPVMVTATTNAGYGFTSWTVNGVPGSTANPTNFPLDAALTIVANFAPYYALTLSNSPASGGTAIATVGNQTGAIVYAVSNSEVTVITTTNRGYSFVDLTLTVSNGSLISDFANFIFALNANFTFVANFVPTPPQIGVFNGTVPVAMGQSSPVALGSFQQYQQAFVTFTVTNFGGQQLVLTNISVPTNGYALESGVPINIAGLGGGAFTVQLNTTTVGTNSGYITITNNDPVNGSFGFAVTGIVRAPAPEIGVLEGTTVITNGQTNAVGFGAFQQDQPGTNVFFTVTNAGGLPLILTNITLPSGFALRTNSPATITSFPFTIASNSSAVFNVEIDPATVVTGSGDIVIINNDPTTNGVFIIPVASEVTTKIIGVSGNLIFGVVPVGSSQTNTLMITNTGNAALTVSNIAYPSPDLSGAWSGTIQPNGSQTVAVKFSPASAANYGGTATINSDAAGGASNILISAFGANDSFLLTILTNGAGSVTPNDAKVIKANTKVSLKAVPGNGFVFAGWTGSANTTSNPLAFLMRESTIVQANFISNPYLPFVGTYNGLFWATNGYVAEATAGMLKGLTLTSKGTYSASLLIGGASKSFSGSFGVDLYSSNSLKIGNGIFGVGMALTSNDFAPLVTGTVFGPGLAADNLIAYRATNNNHLSPAYNLLIPTDANNASSPGGYGYASITASEGTTKTPAAAKIAGYLADGTSFSQSVSVSLDGYVPIYASLYSSKGLLLGWINLDPASSFEALLYWVHPAITSSSAFYQSPFTSTNSAALSPWTDSTEIFGVLTNLAELDGINATNVVTNITVSIGASGKATEPAASVTITPKTGQFTVTIGSGASKVTGHGAILSNTNYGGGYFTTKGNAGAIILGPVIH